MFAFKATCSNLKLSNDKYFYLFVIVFNIQDTFVVRSGRVRTIEHIDCCPKSNYSHCSEGNVSVCYS
ncbi:hypothetical protein ViNHUV68_35110 [Vibrio sp. NH-UV-68]